jgi:hypothetical protein
VHPPDGLRLVGQLGAGGFAFAPRGTLHNFRNTAETPSRLLLDFTPAGMEGFFRDSGQPATGDGPAPPVDAAAIARMMAAAPKYGVEHINEDNNQDSEAHLALARLV